MNVDFDTVLILTVSTSGSLPDKQQYTSVHSILRDCFWEWLKHKQMVNDIWEHMTWVSGTINTQVHIEIDSVTHYYDALDALKEVVMWFN